MDSNTFKGGWHQFKGELKKQWGKLTDDDLMEADGNYEKFMGIVQKRYGDAKDEVRDWTDDWYSRREQDELRRREATTSRNQM
jgi:uncharacterized protein YjbJ (UPF0337 family)